MKRLYLIILSTVFIIACDKPIESDIQFVDLSIIETNTAKTTTQSQGITSVIKMMAPNLCYRFGYFTVNSNNLLWDVHAIGTYPAKPTACLMALYHKDTTLYFPTAVAGQYIVRFYNGSQLFKADTIQVN